jgi:hypothetical protein
VKFLIPEAFPAGLCAAQLKTKEGATATIFVNRPEAWWCQGDAGRSARPGGWLRVFGRCLNWGGSARAGGTTVFLRGPTSVALPTKADCYAAAATLPENLPPGDYEVFVHGGSGGKWGWSNPTKIAVAKPLAWPQTRLNVKDFGAKGDGAADDTQAIRQALEKAGSGGGGVVYFPYGSYRLAAPLRIPAKTVLRGQREDLVQLVWTNPSNRRLDAVLFGTSQFGLEDLSLAFVGADNGLVADVPRSDGEVPLAKGQSVSPQAGDVFLRRVRIRWLLYADHLTIAEANKLFAETAKDGGFGATGCLLFLGGRNIEITDCDLYSSGNVFNLVDAQGALIARNRLSIGRFGWANFDGCDGVLCEDNAFPGGDNMVRAGVTFWSQHPMENVYFARNRLDHVYAQDREGMTTDGASGKYFGPAVSAAAASLTVPPGSGWKPNELAGHTCYVLGGSGRGQWRRVIGNTDTTLQVERPWDVPPTPDSIVGVNHTVARLLVVGNTMADVGIAFQFYGTAMECIVAENRCIRAGGLYSHAAPYPAQANDARRTQPQLFVQYLDNHIVEGNTPFHIRGYDFGANHSVIGLDGSPGPPWPWDWPSRATGATPVTPIPWKWPMASGFVIRGNRLDSRATITLTTLPDDGPTLVQDVIVERNKVCYAAVGIGVGRRAAGVVVRKNTFQQVERPLTGGGLKAALVEP